MWNKSTAEKNALNFYPLYQNIRIVSQTTDFKYDKSKNPFIKN